MPRARQNLRKLATVHAASNGVITHKVYKSPTAFLLRLLLTWRPPTHCPQKDCEREDSITAVCGMLWGCEKLHGRA